MALGIQLHYQSAIIPLRIADTLVRAATQKLHPTEARGQYKEINPRAFPPEMVGDVCPFGGEPFHRLVGCQRLPE